MPATHLQVTRAQGAMLVLGPASDKEREAMSTEENKQLTLRWREELWSKRNVNVLDELCAADYVGHIAGIPQPVRGREALKQLFAAYLAAFDTRVTPEFLIAEGDMVVVRDTNWARPSSARRPWPHLTSQVTIYGWSTSRPVDSTRRI
jgi:hypothetical protein